MKFKWWDWADKNLEGLIPQNRETAKQIGFSNAISMACLFQSRLKQLETAKRTTEANT